ncbi:MAG TPA: hypothetical protein ENK18_08850 [Deltaproteobacteria bacterium]|nr:hypothetical protein [Deltaproteobacteria bacterium]
MAKKKDEKDATADFFGDSDLDWLDDEDEDSVEAARADRSAPTPGLSPSPPPPNKLSSAPTLVFSSVPTLPPGPSPLAREPEPEPEPLPATVSMSVTPPLHDHSLEGAPPRGELPLSELPTIEVEPPFPASKPSPGPREPRPSVATVQLEEDEYELLGGVPGELAPRDPELTPEPEPEQETTMADPTADNAEPPAAPPAPGASPGADPAEVAPSPSSSSSSAPSSASASALAPSSASASAPSSASAPAPSSAPSPSPSGAESRSPELAPAPLPVDEPPARVEVPGRKISGATPVTAPRLPPAPRVRTPKGATPHPAPRRQATPESKIREQSAEGWRSVLSVLVAEASSVEAGAGESAKGILLERASRVAAHQVGDLERSLQLYTEARSSGRITPELLFSQADTLGRLNRYAEQLSLLTELGDLLEGPAKAGPLLDAGLIAWRRLNRPAEAVDHLQRAAAAEPGNYTARALLRALLPAVGGVTPEQRLSLLTELAELAEGGIAADAYLEAASAAEEVGEESLVRAHLEHALEVEPGHTAAFLRLERVLANDMEALAELYQAEADRPGQIEPGWWHAEAARTYQRAGNTEAAVAGFKAAVEEGYPFALRELQGSYVQSGAWFDLEDALAREADALSPEDGAAFTLYRLGWLRESRLENHEAALRAYQRAVKADPTSAPAADAVGRLLRNKHAQQRAFWQERLEKSTLPAERRFLTLQLAEAAEVDQEHDKAQELFKQVLSEGAEGTAAEVARAGLGRVLQRLAQRHDLAELRRAQAAAAATPAERAMWLHEAATILCYPARPWPMEDAEERDAALADLRRALDAEPDHPAAIEAMSMLLEAKDDWLGLAQVLQAAGDATDDPHRRAAYLYRAGRLFAERVVDDGAARACLGHALLADPAFRPARWLLRTVASPGDAAGDAGIYREEAKHAEGRSERAWGLFAAAEAAGPGPAARRDLQRILTESPDHTGALAALEVQCVAEGDEEALTNIYLRALEGPPTPTKARLGARAAVLLARAGKGARALEVLRRIMKMEVEGRPLRACARMALRLGAQDLALEILGHLDSAEDAVERARLQSAAGRPAEALPMLLELLDRSPDALGVAARAATMAQQVGDADAMLRAYSTIARNAEKPSLAAAYGSWTGMQLRSAGKDAEALEHWRIVLSARPHSESALTGVVRGLVATGDRDGLVQTLSEAPPERLAEALADAGEPLAAAEALEAMLTQDELDPGRRLAALIVLERLYEEAEAWQQVHDTLVRRRERCNDPRVLTQADQKRRWLLAEHLAETDAAWELYRRLHDDNPTDREVTEALARIAGARGEVDMAIGYLRELAETASAAEDAARYQRRVGEVYERADKRVEARTAYLDALEHLPSDVEALAGLKRLAEAAEDWPGLVAVLQREAGLAEGARKVDLRRRIAQVNEELIGDPDVAIDAWRSLVEIAPQDPEGLQHLLSLSESRGAWDVFVESGEALAQILSGAEKGALLRRVGIACEDQLGRDDAAGYYQQAVAVVPPDYIAAKRLEGLARSRADWPSAVRALALQAKAEIGEDERITALLDAARIEVEARHDRDSAATFYAQILEIQPNHEPALRFMSTHLFESGRYERAMPICQRLEPVVERGQDLDDFDTRMELSSFYFYFAEMLRRRAEHAEALPRYERALELNPTHLPSLEAVGPLYTEAEQWKQAERVYRQLLQLSGGHGDRQKVASTYTSLGLVERKLGNTEKAYKRFNKALELHPNHVGALKGMALVLEDRSDWSNLLNVYNNIIYHATVPDDVIDAYMTKGRILDLHMQRQDKAAQHYQRSLDFDPQQPVAYLRLAELALRQDAHREAGELAEKALQLDADLVQEHRPLLLLIRASAWQSAGRTTEAERCLREASVLDRRMGAALPDDPLSDPEILKGVIAERVP